MEETNMDALELVIMTIILIGIILVSAMEEDEDVIELSDDEAEEYRKRLVEREEKDVELDKE